MRLIVMFDLPTNTPEDRKNYTIFRKSLIKLGFDMIQYSIYGRITKNNDDSKKYMREIKLILPPYGSVRLLQVTEKQYSKMQILLGDKTPTENLLNDKDILVI